MLSANHREADATVAPLFIRLAVVVGDRARLWASVGASVVPGLDWWDGDLQSRGGVRGSPSISGSRSARIVRTWGGG